MEIDQINLFVQIPSYIFWKDKNSTFLGCNSHFAKIAGLKSCEDVVGMTDWDFIWGADHADLYQAGDHEVITTGIPKMGIIEPQLRHCGKIINILLNKVPFYQNNIQMGILGTYIDIGSVEDHGAIDKTKINIPLTPKQAECLRHIAKGLTAKQIANEMLISSRTVEMHIDILKQKLGCYNKSALIQKAQSLPFIHKKL